MKKTLIILSIVFVAIMILSNTTNALGEKPNKTIMYRGKIPIEVDYNKGVLVVQGKEIPIIVDGDVEITDPSTKDTAWVHLAYDRFDVYIEPTYYDSNTAELNLFFDRFEPRYELMESLTGWSSEKFYGTKLKIYVSGSPSSCSGGYAAPGEAHIIMYKDLSRLDGCRNPYYIDGIPSYGNPGELGDQWDYMDGALHEALHSINPFPVFSRSWLTEGWSEYYGLNILSNYYGNSYPDINQETADYYLFNGWAFPIYWNWTGYVANDYHDTSPANATIQNSAGYDITAWMFSMLRDNYSLPWQDFYTIIDNNQETLDKSWQLGGNGYNSRYTDTHIIDLFEMATGTPMYPVFRYDGPSGPGWGVREWTDLNWYADLTPVLSVSDTIPCVGDSVSLNASIHNNGGVSLEDVSVRFYSNDSLIHQQTVVIGDSSFITIPLLYSAPQGVYNIKVVADEDNLKIETDDSNNADSLLVDFGRVARGDANASGYVELGDVVYLINYLYKSGPVPYALCSGDCNCDGVVALGDVVYLITYLYKGGPPPPC